jgi:hypothetical protein
MHMRPASIKGKTRRCMFLGTLVACSSGPKTTSNQDASTGGDGPDGGGGRAPSGLVDAAPPPAVTLTGCALDSYFAPVTVAGQAFTLLLDTGSTDTAVALSSCTTCDVSPRLTAPSGSCSTHFPEQMSLGWTGDVCSEAVSVGDEAALTMNVVGISDDTDFFTNVDCTGQAVAGQPAYQGVLGVGPTSADTLGDASGDAYVSALVAHGAADGFALLLCTAGGRAWFGGYDPTFASGPPQYTPLSAQLGWTIAVSSIGLGSKSLGPGDPKSIVDTGTPFYSMPTAAYEAFVAEDDAGFTAVFGASSLGAAFGKGKCVSPVGSPSASQVDAMLPPMTMTLPSVGGGSFSLRMPATASYLVAATATGGAAVEYCLAITDSADNGGYSVIGAPLMRANITVFDVGRGRLGFAPQGYCR